MNITPYADIWLQAKDKQTALHNKRKSLIKLIQARENRLANLQTTIGNEINDFRLKIHSVEAELTELENTKDVACLDMLSVLQHDQSELDNPSVESVNDWVREFHPERFDNDGVNHE